MYDAFSTDYDRFVNWDSRLAFELPFLEQRIKPLGGLTGQMPHILDAACGTGRHAIALAQRGLLAAGADLSSAMVERARANAAAYGVEMSFKVAGFGELSTAFAISPLFPFDAILCLGNSLPHLLTPHSLTDALADFAACLRPGGLLIIQNRNFDAVLSRLERWMDPQSCREGQHEWLFLRFYDFDPDGLVTFNILTLYREGNGSWQQRANSTRLYPQQQQELTAAIAAAGFGKISSYGSLAGDPFDPQSSSNLVLVCERNS